MYTTSDMILGVLNISAFSLLYTKMDTFNNYQDNKYSTPAFDHVSQLRYGFRMCIQLMYNCKHKIFPLCSVTI